MTAETKLRTLVDNAQDFKKACDIKVTNENVASQIERAIEYGKTLKADIDFILKYMETVKALMKLGER